MHSNANADCPSTHYSNANWISCHLLCAEGEKKIKKMRWQKYRPNGFTRSSRNKVQLFLMHKRPVCLCVCGIRTADACDSYFRASLITLSRYFGSVWEYEHEKETYAERTYTSTFPPVLRMYSKKKSRGGW